jgi:catechol 2,3-dioxygenase-like lactoylglutathione lyase family enzyme
MPEKGRTTGGRLWARPVFRVNNLAESIEYYCGKLGFTKDWDEGGADSAVAQVSRNGVELILDKHTYFPKAGLPSVITLTLNDVPTHPALDALHRELVAAGAKLLKAPFKVHWDVNIHEMDVQDLDGNVLMFWGHMPKPEPAQPPLR